MNDSLSLSVQLRLQEVCAPFEAAWQAAAAPHNKRPCVADYLGSSDGPERTALLRELIRLDLHYRRQCGEVPAAEDYLRCCPADAEVIRAVFCVHDQLLLALALWLDWISDSALAAARKVCTTEGAKSPKDVLLEQGDLSHERLRLLDALVVEHLKVHGGNPKRSLAALGEMPTDIHAFLNAVVACAQTAPEGMNPAVCANAQPVGCNLDMPEGEAAACLRYRTLRLHDRGGLGEIFVAEDRELHREVALKEIRLEYAHDRNLRRRFLREGEITGRLEHPGVVPVYGMGVYKDGRPFYAMRLIRGETLKDTIRRHHEAVKAGVSPFQRDFSLRRLLSRFIAVCNAVAYAHSQGVIHRDLKPGNIMFGQYGETWVIDWGLAR
jgi:serine/threonine-protein kinase